MKHVQLKQVLAVMLVVMGGLSSKAQKLPEPVTPLQRTYNAEAVLKADAAMAERSPGGQKNMAKAKSGKPLTFTTLKRDGLRPIGTAVKAEGKPAARIKSKRALPAKLVQGNLIGKDFVHEGKEVNCVMTITADATDPAMAHINNFYGLEETVDMTFDLDAGTVAILPQRIWKSTSYGDVYMFPITYEDGKIKYFTTEPVRGTIDENGVIRLGQWGAIVGSGANQGMLLAAIDRGEYYPANATMTATLRKQGVDGIVTYPLLVEQQTPSDLTIYNFGTSSVPVKARVQADKSVTVSEQFIATMGLYGAFNCRPIDLTTNVISNSDPIVGKMVGTDSVYFEPWVAASVMQEGLVALMAVKSGFKTSLTMQTPETLTFNLSGKGTYAEPYLIKTPADLMTLSQTSQKNSFKNKYFRLENDIDMAGVTGYLPIGTAKAAFAGHFNGNGNTIKNLTLDGIAYNYQGLFGVMYEGSSVKNLKMTDVRITANGYFIGAVAGYSMGEIDNCSMSGSVTGNGVYVGGIVGRTYAPLTNCHTSGLVAGNGDVGGVAGYTYHQVTACHSDATVRLPAYFNQPLACVGGIIGVAQSYSVDREGVISDCYFNGTVENSAGYGFTGGIFGYLYAGNVNKCMNTGRVKSTVKSATTEGVGGITGLARDSEMSNLFNAGLVSHEGFSTYVGGLIGYISTAYSSIGGMLEPLFVRNSINIGQATAKNMRTTAGLFGDEFKMDAYPEVPSDKAFTNTWHDSQATGIDDAAYGKPTSFFKGVVPEGFDSNVWTAVENGYPQPKVFAGTTSTRMASAIIEFKDNETRRNMRHDATLMGDVSWTVLPNTDATSLTVNGNTLKLGTVYANDTIAANVDGVTSGRLIVINAVPKMFDGEGTETSPFLIKNVEDFKKLHDAVMHYDHIGDYFLQTADVDFGLTDDFGGVAAGNHLMWFAGVFDGGNHKIKGLKVKSALRDTGGNLLDGSYNYGGLFHLGTKTSVIRNVIIDSDSHFEFYDNAGTVIGHTEGKVENCRNYAPIICGGKRVGGIVGNVEADGVVTGCYNGGAMTDCDDYTGGIAGRNMGTISDCQNDGDISSTGKYTGGVAGASAGSLTRGVNNGAVTGAEYVGGVIGSNSDGTGNGSVNQCVSSGMVTSTGEYVGGIMGYSNGAGEMAANYFDASVNNMAGCPSVSRGMNGVSTSELVTATAPEGLDADKFAFSDKAYPALKAFDKEETGKACRAIYILFGKNEKRTNIQNNVNLSANADVTWTLKTATNFGIADGKLTVTIPETEVAADELTAVYAGGYTKKYELKSIPAILEGAGSAEDPFRIKTSADLTLLANFITSSGMDYDGYYFKVLNDIAYADGEEFLPIARTGVQFQGDFDGNGMTISKFAFTDENSKTGKNIGFFGTIGAKGSVHDLTLDGKITGYSYVGGFAGQLYGKISDCKSLCAVNGKGGDTAGFVGHMFDGSSLTNSVFEGVVSDLYATNYNDIAGFVGYADLGSTIDNCVNKGVVGQTKNTTGTTWTGQQYVGGIAGKAYGTITNCRNQGKVIARTIAGGIVGRLGKQGRIEDCFNEAEVSIENGSTVAGIAGDAVGGGLSYILRCGNMAPIHGKGTVAGIIAKIANGCTVDSCWNTGRISGFSTTGYTVAGVVGQMSGSTAYPTYTKNCWNTGEIYSECSSVGGVIAKASGTEVSDCWNMGKIIVKQAAPTANMSGVGGVIGYGCCKMTRLWNAGDIESEIGGVAGVIGVGAMPIADVSYAANFGNVTSTAAFADKGLGTGGIWGGYGPVTMQECYNFGNITAPDIVAGINPAMHNNGNGGTTILHCYNMGKITATDADAKDVFGVAGLSRYVDTKNPIMAEAMHVEKVYCSTEALAQNANDTYGKRLTPAEMMTADLGEAFTYHEACFPTLAFVDTVAVANLNAAYMKFAEGDAADNVNQEFKLGILQHTSWTAHEILSIDENGTVTPEAVGTGWVTITTDEETPRSKTYEIVVKKATSGIGSETAVKEVENIRYFTVDGMAAAAPERGQVRIAVIRYADGTTATRKVIGKR